MRVCEGVKEVRGEGGYELGAKQKQKEKKREIEFMIAGS